MNFKIPKSINIGSREVTIENKPNLLTKEGAMGRAVFGENIMELLEPTEGAKIDNNTQAITFLHETLHFIFNTMGEYDISDNEKLIDLTANFLQQVLKLKIVRD